MESTSKSSATLSIGESYRHINLANKYFYLSMLGMGAVGTIIMVR